MHYLKILFFSAAAATLFSHNVLANGDSAFPTGPVVRVSMEGNRVVPDSMVLSNLSCRLGLPYSSIRVNHDIHTLMGLGRFTDVSVVSRQCTNGVAVTYRLKECPVVLAWTNIIHSPGPDAPGRLFATRPGSPFLESVWHDDVQRLKEFYREHDYRSVRVSARQVRSKDNAGVTLFTDVYPGPRQFVEEIRVRGIDADDGDAVLSCLHCLPRNLWWFEHGRFDPAKFSEDEEKMRAHYQRMGYLDASVRISISTGSSPSRVVIDVDVDEGPQYTVGRTMWRQRLLSSNSFAQLRELVSVPEGSPYDPGLVKRLQREIERFCVTLSPQQPDIVIRAMIDKESSPLRPVVDIPIS